MADTNIKIEISAVDNASKALAKIQKQLAPMKNKVSKVGTEFDKVDKSIKRSSGSFGKFKGLLAGAITVAGITSFTKSVVEASSRAEDLKTTLETVTGSAKAGDDAFKFINDFAVRTPFDIETLTETFIKLRGAGIEPTEKLLTSFGDMAATSKDKITSLNAITDLFSRTTSGGLGLEDLNRLGDQGIPVFTILEEKLGLARLEVAKFGQSAEGAAQIKDALLEGLDERFGGGMEKASANLSTSLSNMGIAANNALIAVGEGGLSDAINTATQKFTTFIANNEDLAIALGEKLGQAVTFATDGIVMLFENAHKAQPIFDVLGVIFKEVVAPAAVLIFDALVKVSEILKPMIEATLPVAKSIFESLGAVMTDIVIPAFNTVVSTITTVIDSITLMIDKIGAGLTKVKEFGSGVKDTVSGGMSRAGESIGNFAEGAKGKFFDLYDYVVGNSVIPDLVDGVQSWMGGKLTSILGPVGDFVEGAKSKFWSLYDAVVGNSIIPDLVTDVGKTMDKLPSKMVNPIETGVAQSRKAFEPINGGGVATANSNVNFNISGVNAGGGSGQFNQAQMSEYIEGVATQVAYTVLRQNTGFGGAR
jgi:phage tail tape-measure protein